jgi:peptidoglycan/xylan/chitin deacetylase (PgdA/CDA1 family)
MFKKSIFISLLALLTFLGASVLPFTVVNAQSSSSAEIADNNWQWDYDPALRRYIKKPKPTKKPSETPVQGFRRPLITLAFDDGRISQFTTGRPLMKKYGLRGTYYIITGPKADKTAVLDGVWAMTPQNVLTLYGEGNEIGSHSVTHSDFTTLPINRMDYELIYSKLYLLALTRAQIDNFALPNGMFNDTVLTETKKYYRTTRLYFPDGINTKSNLDFNKVLTVGVRSTTPESTIQRWIDTAKKDNSWLVLTYHSFESPVPDEFSITPETFEKHLQLIRNSAVPVVTTREAVNELSSQGVH